MGLSNSCTEELQKSDNPLSYEPYHNLIGTSKPMQLLYQIIDNVATSQATILITGENGTGKELCAEAIYKQSNRANKPFMVCNCAAIPENLMESHLFGHVKGAFTGAMNNQEGLVSKANGGTLFLDEIGELPPVMQSTLLRFMQTKTFTKVGSHQLEKVDVRLICATNRNLLAEIKAGTFREDLYYRMNTVEIELPALHERGQDILQLATFFLNKYAQEEQKEFQGLSPEAEKMLLEYHWPGNVRQLQHTIHNVVILNKGKVITAEMLSAKISAKMNANPSDKNPSLATEPTQALTSVANQSEPVVAITVGNTLRSLDEIEKEVIFSSLKLCNGNVVKTAHFLKVSHGTLYNKLKRWENKSV